MDFLLEIGTEEIPARMIDSAREELARRVGELLQRERLSDAPEIEAYSTPRRLAVVVSEVESAQPDVSEQVSGPSLKVAYKDGKPTQAAEAFARKVNVAVDSLEKITTPKGEYLAATVQKKGRSASDILAEALPKEIAGIYWAKSMYWRGKSAERFVRPVRWLVTLLDGELVPLEFAGIRAGDASQGHRILSSGALTIAQPAEYVAKLAASFVIVGAAEREQRIRKALDAATRTIHGARWCEDRSLLETVVNLTEFPSVVLGSFDPEYLTLPEEVLVTVMRDHQKYFALEDASGKLLPHFLAVLNTDGDPDGLIRHGNERVLRARFNDARFFWNTDQKIPLRDRVQMLKAVTFQKDLGSYYEKTRRVQKLGSLIAETIRSAGGSARPGIIFKAAHLCKADLTTELVKEFTELQGIIGGLYARVQELDPILPRATVEAIADAIYDHYKPESMDDTVPRSAEGGIVAIADKADSIAGMFALGLQPTGSKDPFALRRAANGIVKIIAEHKLPLPFMKLFDDARQEYVGTPAEDKFVLVIPAEAGQSERRVPRSQVPDAFETQWRSSISVFMYERLAFYLQTHKGFAYDTVSAVLAAGGGDIVDIVTRAQALTTARKSDRAKDLEAVCISFKRIKNILKQAEERGISIPDRPNELLMGSVAAETALWMNGVVRLWSQYEVWRESGTYDLAISQAAALRPLLDRFFDEVMVMAQDEAIRANRLAILQKLYKDFSTIADFSEIVTEGK